MRLLHKERHKVAKRITNRKISTYELTLWKIEHNYHPWVPKPKTTDEDKEELKGKKRFNIPRFKNCSLVIYLFIFYISKKFIDIKKTTP